jgi:hypothetical protein
MKPKPHGYEDFQDRLRKLEKPNRRFKQIGVAAAIVPSLLFLMGQAASRKTVEANEFILRDSGGNIRGKLSADESSAAQFLLFDPNGNEKVRVDSGAIGSGTRIMLSGSAVILSNSAGDNSLLAPNTLLMTNVGEKSGIELGPGKLRIADAQGFSAAFGVTDMVTLSTGETRKTSAASLVLFDKNKNVIWKVS